MAASLVLAIAAAWGLTGLRAAAEPSAQALFDAKDYAAAAELWRAEAAENSSDAKFMLGFMAEHGLGQPRDPALAFQWYLAAASEGYGEAQFNVGVMLDAGIGAARDAETALLWYVRAALRGHVRSAYNAGLLFRAGDGVPQSDRLAAYWFEAAEGIEAANMQRARLRRATGRSAAPVAPRLVFDEVGPDLAELVWLPGGPGGGGDYLVEVLAAPGKEEDYGPPLLVATGSGSGLLSGLAGSGTAGIWRVSNLSHDGRHYAPSPWHGPSRAEAPVGRVVFELGAGDPRLDDLAALLAGDLRRAGFWVRMTPASGELGTGAAAVSVAYSYAEDRETASRVAAYLPTLAADDVSELEPGATLPGEIRVRLALPTAGN